MSKRCLKTGGRPRAFWGAVIPAVASLVGGIISSSAAARNQREAIAAQNRLQEQQNQAQQSLAAANTLNNYFSTLNEDEDDMRVLYKKGGRRKLRNAAQITDGGYAIPIDYSTYLLQGGSHNQVNETGQTGIGINAGGKEIEAEGGEVIQRKGNELRVFSNQPILNGVSPSEAVLEGANKNEVFKAQEAIKRRYNLRNGYSSPVGNRRKALWGAEFTTPDYIGLGTNVLASILAGTVANRQYGNLLKDINFETPTYTDAAYVAGPTRYFNSAQRSEVERLRQSNLDNISRNTASSNVANERMQTTNTNALYELNKLWDEKANKETEMRQANAERLQRTLLANAEGRNRWLANVADIKNKQLATRLGLQEAKVNSNVGMIQGIGSSIGGFLQQGIDNYQARQARQIAIASSPYGTAARMKVMGVDFTPKEMEDNLSFAEYTLNNLKNDNSEEGIRNYNAAVDDYNVWANSLGRDTKKYTRKTFRNASRTSITNSPIIPKDNSSGISLKNWDWRTGQFIK